MKSTNPIELSSADLEKAPMICARYEVSEKAREVLEDTLTPDEFVERLLEKSLIADAVEFMAYALGRRQAVWWATQCVRVAMEGQEFEEKDQAALEAAEQWVIEPTEERRRAAEAAGKALEYKTLSAGCATAAFFAGGTIADPEGPILEPDRKMTPDLVKKTVLLSGVLQGKGAAQAPPHQIEFVALGQDLSPTAEQWQAVAHAMADEHAAKGVKEDDERRRLFEAVKKSKTQSPNEIDDRRLSEENRRAMGPKIEAEKKRKAEVEALIKKQEEAEKKRKAMEKKGWLGVGGGGKDKK